MRAAVLLMMMVMTRGAAEAAAVSWTGAGDNLTWSTAANWSGNAVPATSDDVTISSGSGAALVRISTAVQVRSLNTNVLVEITGGGSLRVNASSALTGGFTMVSGDFTANGSSTVVTVTGGTTLQRADIHVTMGAKVSFPEVTTYTSSDAGDVLWYSSYSAELSFPNLTTITGSSVANREFYLLADFNGKVLMPALTSITKPNDGSSTANGGMRLRAAGGTSKISAPLLATFQDNDVVPNSSMEATGSGFLEAPLLLAPVGINIDLNATSNPGRFTSLVGTRSFQINNGEVTMSNLDTITGFSNIEVWFGARLTFPNVTSYTQPNDKSVLWRGTYEAELIFPNLTTITGSNVANRQFYMLANFDGKILLPALTAMTKPNDGSSTANGGMRLLADSGASRISVPLLTTFQDNDIVPNSFLEAEGNGVLEAPLLLAPVGASINMNAASNAGRFTSLVGARSLWINSGNVVMSNLDTIVGLGTIGVLNNAKLTIPNVTTYILPNDKDVLWRGGYEGELNFPNLVSISGNATRYSELHILANFGGKVVFPALTSITKPNDGGSNDDGGIDVEADGGSVISMPLLATFEDNDPVPTSSLEASGTSLLEAPLLTAPVGVNIYLNAASNPGRFTSLTGARSFWINNGNVTMSKLDTIAGFLEIGASNGAKLSFPNVTTYNQTSVDDVWWQGTYDGELTFPNLTRINGTATPNRQLQIRAIYGGKVFFPVLTAIIKPNDHNTGNNGGIKLTVDANCLISAPFLTTFEDHDAAPNSSINTSSSGIIEIGSLRNIVGVDMNLSNPPTIAAGQEYVSYGTYQTSLINNGVVQTSTSGKTLRIQGSLSGTGDVRVINGAKLVVDTSLVLNGAGLLTLGANSSIDIKGSLLGNTTQTNVGNPAGTVTFNGAGNASSPQQIEVMSRNLGAVAAGFKNNFAFGAIVLGNNTRLQLVDLARNTTASTPEAVYANAIVVPATSTLDLNGLKLYARGVQVAGTVINGAIVQMPDSGALAVNNPAPGAISVGGELDEWVFFGRGGRSMTIAVETGGSGVLTPTLGFAEVTLKNAQGVVVGSAVGTVQNLAVAVGNVLLPADGNYTVTVKAPAAQSARTGNYRVTAWDVTPEQVPLVINQTSSGRVEAAYSADAWTFTATAGQQLKFDLLNATAAGGVVFTLRGPTDWVGFNQIAGDSELVTLPADGLYTLTAVGTGGANDLAYSFRMVETQQTPLDVMPYVGQLKGSGQAQIYYFQTEASYPIELTLANQGAGNRVEMYVSRGVPPTRTSYEHAVASGPGANRKILIPSASVGTWYVLVYASKVQTPGAFSLLVQATEVSLTKLSMARQARNVDAVMSLTGAGFHAGTQVQLVSAAGDVYAATSVTVDSHTQVTATFAANTAPAGSYSVRVVQPNGAASTMPDAFNFLEPGAPKLETKIILPRAFGRHAVATIYVEYANTGNAAMPAPLLVLKSSDADGSDRPILTLDESRIVQNFWSGTGGLPPGTSHEVFILACGSQPGLLAPGERIQVPVHYMGLLQPWSFADSTVELEVRHWTADDASVINWTERKEPLRPPTLDPATWDIVFANLTAGLGTTADYVRMLNDNATYLSRQGQRVVDVDALWNFEVQQAYGFSAIPLLESATDASVAAPGVPLSVTRQFAANLRSRHGAGMFGQGWYTPWQMRLVSERNGDLVKILRDGGAARVYSKDIRKASYFSDAGDSNQLVPVGGTFELRQPNGTVTRFRTDGLIDYMQDANGNRVSATWNGAGQLTALTHTSGAGITLIYGGNGLVSQLIESTGRTVTYAYQGNYLQSATTGDGKVTSYTYETAGSGAVRHALKSASRAGVTRHFTWEARGWLESTYLAGGEELALMQYDSAGGVKVTQAGGETSLYFEHQGLLAKVVDPLGRITLSEYDKDLRLYRLVLPTGESRKYTWCSCGSPTSIMDELGNTTRFSYDHPLKKMTSFVDAKNNQTRYTYDEKGNPLTTIYPNNTVERLASYTAAGFPQAQTNRRGDVINYTWTALGKIDRQTFADGTYADFDYDGRGNLAQVTEHPLTGADKVTLYTYAPATDGDRLKKVTYPNGKWVEYFYDGQGRRYRMTDSAGGDTRYEYDGAGRLWKLRGSDNAVIAEYLYDGARRLSRINKGNGTYTTYEYDLAGQVLHLINHAPNGTPNSRFDYEYDARGQRTSMDTLDGKWTYKYDATGQLVGAIFASTNGAIPNQNLAYHYDALGNRTSTVINGVTAAYVANALNQYTSVDGVAQQYDADGNLVSDGEHLYEYDAQNRLIRVTGTEGVTEYEYDAMGSRTATVLNGQRTEYLLDPTGLVNVIGESASESESVRYTHGIGLVSREKSSMEVVHFDFDAAGSMSNVSEVSGSSTVRHVYGPFGESSQSLQQMSSAFQFVGQLGVSADETGLSYMRARFFSSRLGRFLTADPIGLQGHDANIYRYAINSPVNFIDPMGLRCAKYDTVVDPGKLMVETGQAIQGTVGFARWTPGGTRLEQIQKGVSALGGAKTTFETHPTKYVSMVGRAINGANNPNSEDGKWLRCDDESTGENRQNGADSNKRGNENLGGSGPGTKGGDGSGGNAGSYDPNEKIGPGFGPEGWVKSDALLPYRINFENLGPGSKDENGNPYTVYATAPAQRVMISDALESAVDWDTFRITEFGWGDTVINVPEGTTHYTGSVPMTYNGKTFEVEVDAGIDFSAGRIYVRYQTMNPGTGLPPDVLTGFLPPEDGTGRGMGHFSYTVRSKPNLPFNTEIRNVAYIQFDVNETIGTDQVDPQDPTKGVSPDRQALVTLDNVAPTSTITALGAASNSSSFLVSWGGSDSGAGLASYDVYVSDNGGAWTLWLANTSATSGVYNGYFGHTYGFRSVARDHVGNVQTASTSAQAATTVVGVWDPQLTIAGGAVVSGSLPVTLTYVVEAGYDYTVLYSEDLVTWLPLPGAPHNTGTHNDAVDKPRRFYRLSRIAKP